MKYTYSKKDTIIKFYKTLKFSNFLRISEEKREILDTIANNWRPFFVNQSIGMSSLMTFVAEKMITSSKNYGLTNGDEIAYFFIKIVDPDLLFLEVYESANKIDEIKELCMKNFRFHDKFLIYLERCYNKRFHEYTPDELWSREKIKR